MYTTTLKAGNVVTFYDNIHEMPMCRFHAFNTNLSQDKDTGSTWQDFEGHRYNVVAFLAANKKNEAINELENMRLGFWLMLDKVSTACVALAALVHDIDGKETSLTPTDDSLLTTSKELETAGITPAQVTDLIEEIKKKSTLN